MVSARAVGVAPDDVADHDPPLSLRRLWACAWAILFTASLRSADLLALFGFPRSQRHAGVRADEIFVYFADFERVAKWEVHDLVAGCELERARTRTGQAAAAAGAITDPSRRARALIVAAKAAAVAGDLALARTLAGRPKRWSVPSPAGCCGRRR